MTRDDPAKAALPHLQNLLKFALSSGASGAEFLQEGVLRREMSATGTSGSPLQQTHEDTLHGRIFVADGACATFSINATLLGRHEASIEKAIARANRANANPGAGPCERFDIQERGLGLLDPRYASIDDEALEELLELNQSEGPRPHQLHYTDTHRSRFFLSSSGYHASSTSTFYKLRLSNEIPDRNLSVEELACGRAFSHVGSIPFGRTLDARIADLSQPGSVPSQPIALVLPTRVIAWILNALSPLFDVRQGESKHRFFSKLENGVLGSKILHVVDDPVATGGVRTRAFDDRGVAPIAVPVIREGVIGNFFMDPKTARERDIRPTGHYWAGQMRASNLVMRPGNRSRTQMLTEVADALELDSLTGELNLKTGHLKAHGPALVLEKGKAIGAVRKVQLDLAVSELFQSFKEVASNQLRSSAVDSATVLTHPLEVDVEA